MPPQVSVGFNIPIGGRRERKRREALEQLNAFVAQNPDAFDVETYQRLRQTAEQTGQLPIEALTRRTAEQQPEGPMRATGERPAPIEAPVRLGALSVAPPVTKRMRVQSTGDLKSGQEFDLGQGEDIRFFTPPKKEQQAWTIFYDAANEKEISRTRRTGPTDQVIVLNRTRSGGREPLTAHQRLWMSHLNRFFRESERRANQGIPFDPRIPEDLEQLQLASTAAKELKLGTETRELPPEPPTFGQRFKSVGARHLSGLTPFASSLGPGQATPTPGLKYEIPTLSPLQAELIGRGDLEAARAAMGQAQPTPSPSPQGSLPIMPPPSAEEPEQAELNRDLQQANIAVTNGLVTREEAIRRLKAKWGNAIGL